MAKMTQTEKTVLTNQKVIMEALHLILTHQHVPGGGRVSAHISMQIGYTDGMLSDG